MNQTIMQRIVPRLLKATIVKSTRRILGCSILAAEAGEMIGTVQAGDRENGERQNVGGQAAQDVSVGVRPRYRTWKSSCTAVTESMDGGKDSSQTP